MFAHAAAPSQCEPVKIRFARPNGRQLRGMYRLKFLLTARFCLSKLSHRCDFASAQVWRKKMLAFWLESQ